MRLTLLLSLVKSSLIADISAISFWFSVTGLIVLKTIKKLSNKKLKQAGTMNKVTKNVNALKSAVSINEKYIMCNGISYIG